MHLRRCDFLFLLLVLMCFFIPDISQASVTMLGNRVIYPSSAKSVDVQLKNNDSIPYVVQAWFDNGNSDSKPDQAVTAPFIVNPPIFRIKSESGQIMRVIFTGADSLPEDRESVYWFNILQIPPASSNHANKNAMMVMLKNRIKVFYRPTSIGKPKSILDGMKVKYVYDNKRGNGIEIDNQQPWFASLVNASINVDGKTARIKTKMLSPFSNTTLWFGKSLRKLQGQGVLTLTVINDQGASTNEVYPVHFR